MATQRFLTNYIDAIDAMLSEFAIPNDFRQQLGTFFRKMGTAVIFGADIGDASVLLRGSQNTVSGPSLSGLWFNTPLTSARTVSLPPLTEVLDGERVTILRSATSANGSFAITVALAGSAALKVLSSSASQIAEVTASQVNNAWLLSDLSNL